MKNIFDDKKIYLEKNENNIKLIAREIYEQGRLDGYAEAVEFMKKIFHDEDKK